MSPITSTLGLKCVYKYNLMCSKSLNINNLRRFRQPKRHNPFSDFPFSLIEENWSRAVMGEWKRGMAKEPSGPQKLQCCSTDGLTWHPILPQGHSLALGPCPEPDPANTSLASLYLFPAGHSSTRWSSGDTRVAVPSVAALCLHGLGGKDTPQTRPGAPAVPPVLAYEPCCSCCYFISQS